MKRKRQPEEEKRIYILVPQTVDIGRGLTIDMEPGRLMAQCSHVSRKMENEEAQKSLYHPDMQTIEPYQEITTIVLSVRNSRELEFMYKQLYGVPWPVFRFEDINPEFYGHKSRVLTAVCTAPMPVSLANKYLGHLELYA
jgi:hypothetical protein